MGVLDYLQFSSVAQLCPILCDPMNCSTPGLPVHHQLPEFTQTHVHLTCVLRNLYNLCPKKPVKKQQLEPDMEQLTGSKLGNEYNRAVYSHPA